MRAMVLKEPGDIGASPLSLEYYPQPEIGPGDVRLRVLCCGLCHTDLHVIEGDLPSPKLPLIPGHQIVGDVDAIGADVSDFAVGDRAGIAWLRWTDGTCRYCLGGRENLCERAVFTGYRADGGYAEYAVAPASFVYKLPAKSSPVELAPLLCAGIIGYRALKLSGAKAGDRLGLYGFGASAHLTIQVAQACGCEVFVFTRSAEHQRLARSLGASWVGRAEDGPVEALDAAISFTPAGSLVPVALRSLRPGGTLALAGITMSDIPSFPYQLLYREPLVRSVANNTRADAREFLQIAAETPLHREVETYELDQANLALRDLKQSRLRAAGVLLL